MAESGSLRLKALAERYWQFLRHEFPLTALLAGQPNDEPTMFREAPSDFERRADRAVDMLAELSGIPLAGLSFQERNTHRLLRRELDDLRQVRDTAAHLRPWLLPAGPEFNTVYFANATQLADTAAAQAYLARLATLPAYFRDVEACLQAGTERGLRYPRAVLQAALVNIRAAVAAAAEELPWFGPFRRCPAAVQPSVQPQAGRARALIEQSIVPAVRALADFMEQALLPRARDSIACTDEPQGAAFYAFWVGHFTTVAMEPAQIHALGLAEVARLEAEIATVAAQAGFAGDVDGYRRHLRDDPAFYAPSAEALLERAQALAKRIDLKIPSIIGHLPRACYGVQSIPPAAADKLPLAYAQPSSADGGSPGIFWISSLPQRVPVYVLPSLALHEAWPGHLMHIALMQEMDALPMFRRANFTKYSACLEGWAMYCESLGQDLGLYRTPHEEFGRLDMEMWRACRLVVDTGIHLHGWSRDRAIDYMAARLALSRQAIEAEVDRYIAMPAQALGYMIGGLKFRELRRRAQARLGASFKLRDYHDQLIAAGAVTLPVLDEVIDQWLDRHAA